MIRVLSTSVLLIAIVMAAYLYMVDEQVSDLEKVCSLFPEGADVGDLQEIESHYSVKLMGPFDVEHKPGAKQAVFCAVLTMCDASCWVEFHDNRVIRAEVSKR